MLFLPDDAIRSGVRVILLQSVESAEPDISFLVFYKLAYLHARNGCRRGGIVGNLCNLALCIDAVEPLRAAGYP